MISAQWCGCVSATASKDNNDDGKNSRSNNNNNDSSSNDIDDCSFGLTVIVCVPCLLLSFAAAVLCCEDMEKGT